MIQVFCFTLAKTAANKCDKAKARRVEKRKQQKKNHKIHKNGDERTERKKFDLLINIK